VINKKTVSMWNQCDQLMTGHAGRASGTDYKCKERILVLSLVEGYAFSTVAVQMQKILFL